MSANAVSPFLVRGGKYAKAGAWVWFSALWVLFIMYCVFLLVQAVDKTKHPVQSTGYETENGFAAPSIVLCSFGSYNLSYFEAMFPNLYGGRWEVRHDFSDLTASTVANYSQPWQESVTRQSMSNAYGCNDLISFSNNLGGSPAWPGFQTNFSAPQLLGMIRSAAIIAPDPIEAYNNLSNVRWCVMWTPYRMTLGYPPSDTSKNQSIDTGSVWNRQLSSRQVYRVAINLNGAAIQQDEAWQWVSSDGPDAMLETDTLFPPVLSLQFVDFSGPREEEWLHGSASSEYLRGVLQQGDPDGFELVALNNNHQLSVQKQVTTKLSRAQNAGWPWPAWPWSDASSYKSIQYKVQSTSSVSLGEEGYYQNSVTGGGNQNWTHVLVIGMLRSTRQTLCITDVPAVVGLLGNFGGAYSLLVVCYGIFYAIQSPDFVTEFQLPGSSVAKRAAAYFPDCKALMARCWPFNWIRKAKPEFQPFVSFSMTSQASV